MAAWSLMASKSAEQFSQGSSSYPFLAAILPRSSSTAGFMNRSATTSTAYSPANDRSASRSTLSRSA